MEELKFFSDYLVSRYGRKLYRVPLDLALGCPNRENRFGPGCVFCAENGSRARHLRRNLDLAGQVKRGIDYIRGRYPGADPAIAYFQAFTSTYAPVEELRKLYREALAQAAFKVVMIGTRPDALPQETVEFLAELGREYEVWVELGVQSCCDETLRLIRRGHDFAAVEDAVRRLDAAGIRCAAHLIAGLPGETREEFVAGARKIAKLPFRAVKLHPLLILRGTALAAEDFPVKVRGLNEYEYAAWIDGFLRELPEGTLLMRLTAEADPAAVIAPHWWMSKGEFLEFFRRRFAEHPSEEAFAAIRTGDGSPTLYHPEFRQHFHSLAGAATEAEKKFVAAAHLPERLRRNVVVRLLDVGYGLGATAAAASRCAEQLRCGKVEIITQEFDLRVFAAARRVYPADALEYRMSDALETTGVFQSKFATVTLLTGDARTTIAQICEPLDVVFQDGFSPDCNPELWSYDWVRKLSTLLKRDGVCVSYCSAFPYRGALLRAGLAVGESEPFGRRRGGTVAAWEETLLPLPLPEKERGILLCSTAGVAYRDPGLKSPREAIFHRRERTVARLRARGVPKWYKPGQKGAKE